MDRGNITLFAKGRKSGTSTLGFIGHKDVGQWSVCSTVFTSLILATKDAGVYLVLLKDFYVVCQDHWFRYKLFYRGARVIWWQLCDLQPSFQGYNCPLSTVIWATNQPWSGFWTFNIRHSVHLGRHRKKQILRPWGFQELEAPRFQDSRHIKVVWLSALLTGHIYPSGNIPGTNFYWRLRQPQGHSAARRITPMKNASDTIGNRTRHLRACSAVSQLTVPPCIPKQTLNTICSHCPIVYTSERFSNISLHTLIIPLLCAWNYHTASRPRREWCAGSTQFEPPQQLPME